MGNVNDFSELERDTLRLLSKNVRYLRRDLLNTTLNELANLTGASRDVICRIEDIATTDESENVNMKFNLTTVIKLCEGTGITLAEMLCEDISKSEEIKDRVRAKDLGIKVKKSNNSGIEVI